MGVLLQGFYKKAPGHAVPSPADGDASQPWWWDRLASQANDLALAGFSAVWLPPVLKTASGADRNSDGYGPFDDYDIGSRNQKGTVPTRYGNREQLQRCVAILRANGIDVYLDMVEHQRIGDETPFVFRYPGADETPDIGRFPKDPLNFVPQVPRDPDLGGAVADDIAFGRELAPINAKPPHFVSDNLINAADWLSRALDVQGYRIDDVKGLSTDFLQPFLNSKSMAGKFAVGEFFDGNRVLVNGWIFNPRGMDGRVSAFDFPLKFVLTAMCNNPGRFNMADLDHVGLAGISPLNAVTFVENHDTDLKPGQNVVINKILGYAYILTSEGYPCVYYRDYDMGPDGYKLKPEIDNLIWVHEKLAAGATQQRWKDFDVFAYERLGGPHLLVCLNNNPGSSRTISVATGFGPMKTLHDYTGHTRDVETDVDGNVSITIPQNINGLGYVCLSVEGQGGGFETRQLPVTQDFEGAQDLDILPALNGKSIQVGRVWCAANSAVNARLISDTTGWTNASAIQLELLGPNNQVLAQQTFNENEVKNALLNANVATTGFHTFRLRLTGTPDPAIGSPFKLSVSYMAKPVFNLLNDTEQSGGGVGQPEVVGQWSGTIPLANVPIHTHVLPTGKVLFWGRRDPPGTPDFPSLNQHETHAFIWDPSNPTKPAIPTNNQPRDSRGNLINLFCSGHTFLADGRLLVTGGHLFDSQGLDCSTFYDCFADSWAPAPVMNNGRWYPTTVTLSDGRPFVCAGSFPTGLLQPPMNSNAINNIPQVLENGIWRDLTDFEGLPLFPRFHVVSNGALFMAGPLATTYLFENLATGENGTWVPKGERNVQNADYAPSVMYGDGKIIFIGGGGQPTNAAETIDLNIKIPNWVVIAPMKFRRRQHNATLLPDGTVLVTGGSQGPEFDGLNPGEPVHVPELWDPATGVWTSLAPESVDRCYHSTAVLLPDGRVFSGGGGEYAPVVGKAEGNPPVNTHADCQLFSPPYLFKGPRPVIGAAPDNVTYGASFEVSTSTPKEISLVTLIRLSSVTHSFNMNQRINFLQFNSDTNKLIATAPESSASCPPGHYMLFILNGKKVPSEAKIIQVGAIVAQQREALPLTAISKPTFPAAVKATWSIEKDSKMKMEEKKPPVVVGVTPICPYGIAACWGGAYEALRRLDGVRLVRPIPDSANSTAFVYLDHEGLPDLDAWGAEFAHVANGTHFLRGVEITLAGTVSWRKGGNLLLHGNMQGSPLPLYPMMAADKVQWDATTQAPRPLEPKEQSAWQDLENIARGAEALVSVVVAGPLKKVEEEYILEVRKFSLQPTKPLASCCEHTEVSV
ncbi:MAG TPA: galactose oxidase-like domain-containing protein [Puia sp.]|nr:galactose oxidase-like domain-containing protein [Puia sp.]